MNASSQPQETLAILQGFFQGIAARDPETIASFFAEEMDWYIPESDVLPWTGKRTRKSEIVKALQLLFDAHIDGEDQFETDHMFMDGKEVAVFGKASRLVKKTGKRFTTPFCQRFTIADGKIKKFLMLEDTPEIEKAFQGN